MADTIYLGTHKGLFTLGREGGRWQIRDVDFLGEPVTQFQIDCRDGTQFATLTTGHYGAKLWRRSPGGPWQECAVPVYPEGGVVADRLSGGEKPATLTEIWAIEPGSENQSGRLWAGTIPGGLFRSDDHGDSWQLIESIWNEPRRKQWFGGGKDDAGIHSVCVDPRDDQHVSFAVSCGGVWTTHDDGESWECLGKGLRAEYMPPDQAEEPNSQDPHLMVHCQSVPDTMWIQHHNGIFRSENGGRNWIELEAEPATFGFAVCADPNDPLTAWFVPGVKDECRVPVDGKLVVNRTRDGGKTFETLREGLPQQDCYDIVYRHSMDVDETGGQLAMGSTTGNVWTTDDAGDSWQRLDADLPMVYRVRLAP